MITNYIKTNYTCAIVDDEALCIETLNQSLSYYPQITVAGTAQNADDGKKLILEQCPDLLFLDVELQNTNGLELLHELREQINWPIQVIFYTAYEKYLLQALRESAFDYLLKPYTTDDFQMVINRFLLHATEEHTKLTFHETLSHLMPQNKTFMVSTITGYQLLRIEQIGYFEYVKTQKKWEVILADGKRLFLKRNTTAEDILRYSSSFIQISQQQIINIDYLASIKGKECFLIPPFNHNTKLIVSRNCLKALHDKFDLI
jgi:two-component system LytT family response regulator